MDLDRIGPADLEHWEARFAREGFLQLPEVELPDGFRPRATDLVFVQALDACEVWVDRGLARDTPAGPRDLEGPVLRDARLLADGPDFRQAFLRALQALEAPEVEPGADPAPESLLTDLVALARRRPVDLPVRPDSYRQMQAALLRETCPGVALVGPAGTGKTTLVHRLATAIARREPLPRGLSGVALHGLELGRLLENTRAIGDLERQVRTLLETPGRPVLFLDEIHQVARPELRPLVDLLKPAMQEGTLRIIGASTPIEWRRLEDPAFRRRLLELPVPEASPAEALSMLQPRKALLERHHRLRIQDDTVRHALLLAHRHLPGQAFPSKAVDVLDHAAALQRVQPAGDADALPDALSAAHVTRAVAARCGLSPDLLVPGGIDAVSARVRNALGSRLRGQKPAVDRIVQALESRLAQRHLGWDRALQDLPAEVDRRPLATLLCCGPTGVGKTWTARLLADTLFEGRMITLHGSDAGDEAPHGIAAWVGAPPGYVRSDIGGSLTNGLRQHRSCVILVDEIEKAGMAAMVDVLLPLLGAGEVTDRNSGETLHAGDCIVVCTGNLEPPPARAEARLGFAGPGTAAAEPHAGPSLESFLSAVMPPELLGRFHAVVPFQALDDEALTTLWADLLCDLERRLGEGTRLELDDGAQELVVQGLARVTTGARGVRDLFEALVLPAVVDAPAGQAVALVADGRGTLCRMKDTDPDGRVDGR